MHRQALKRFDLGLFMPATYKAREPILAICNSIKGSPGRVEARAPALGMLIEGNGKSNRAALRDLAELAIGQRERLMRIPIRKTIGQARYCRQRLKKLIRHA